MWQVFLLVIPAFLVLDDDAADRRLAGQLLQTLVFGAVYNYAHLRVHQQFENWYCAAAAVVMFSRLAGHARGGRNAGDRRGQDRLCGGDGTAGVWDARLVLGSAYDQNRVWYLFWEETTELLLIFGVCFVLWVFRHTLAPRLVAWEERAKRLLTSALT